MTRYDRTTPRSSPASTQEQDLNPRALALCEDCPPEGYPTDKTRCLPCPRRSTLPQPASGSGAVVEALRTLLHHPENLDAREKALAALASIPAVELVAWVDPKYLEYLRQRNTLSVPLFSEIQEGYTPLYASPPLQPVAVKADVDELLNEIINLDDHYDKESDGYYEGPYAKLARKVRSALAPQAQAVEPEGWRALMSKWLNGDDDELTGAVRKVLPTISEVDAGAVVIEVFRALERFAPQAVEPEGWVSAELLAALDDTIHFIRGITRKTDEGAQAVITALETALASAPSPSTKAGER